MTSKGIVLSLLASGVALWFFPPGRPGDGLNALDVVLDPMVADETRVIFDVRSVASQLVKEWSSLAVGALNVTRLPGGTTNILFRVSQSEAAVQPQRVLVRVYGLGSELLADRSSEFTRIENLYHAGLGAKVYGTFRNGYVYEYKAGSSLNPPDLVAGKFTRRIAEQLGRWHKADMPGNKSPVLFRFLRQWLDLVPSHYQDELKQARFRQLSLPDIRRQVDQLERVLNHTASPIVYCHNDLNAYNVIHDDATGSVTIVDYECAGWNPRGFDLANHFCEYAGLDLDFSLFPSRDQQYEFFRSYLSTVIGGMPSDRDLDALYNETRAFVPASHYFWGAWALIQANVSTIAEMDFMKYAVGRFQLGQRALAELDRSHLA